MGFKRTSEGRVFFRNFDDKAEDTPASQSQQHDKQKQPSNRFVSGSKAEELRADIKAQSHGTQTQILTLLKTLNERLKATQDERNAMRKELDVYKHLIQNLEEKSDRAERAYLTLESGASGEAVKDLENTRKLIFDLEDKAARADKMVSELKKEITQTKEVGAQVIKRQKTLEDRQKEQALKMAQGAQSYAKLTKRVKDGEQKTEDISAKLEETGVQQARLTRKVEKAVEDRARFMRKIERIEETVLQTRDSLNAKAMVLLTDQGVKTQNDGEALLNDPELQAELARLNAQAEEDMRKEAAMESKGRASPFTAMPPPAQKAPMVVDIDAGKVAAGIAVVAALVAVGWVVTRSDVQSTFPISSFETPAIFQSAQTPDSLSQMNTASLPEMTQSQPVNTMDWSINTDTSSFTSAAPQTTDMQGDTQNAVSANQQPVPDDIGAVDLNNPEQVEQLLQDNPNAVASALNALEPSKPAPEQAAQTQAAQAEASPSVASPAVSVTPQGASPSELRTMMSADTNLTGVLKDIENQAFEGIPEAQHDLAAVYTAGHGGVAQEYERAAFWFTQAADNGVANAAYNLGVLNHQGLGMTPDMDKAIGWYERAADLGHPEAQYNLGIAYIEGIGVPYDPQKAAAYFNNAANNDIMEAAYNLGLIYENGLLGEPKPDEALMWYKTAADKGSPEARQALIQLAETLDISLEDVNKLAESMKVLNKSEALIPVQAPVQSRAQSSAQTTASLPAATAGTSQPLQPEIRTQQTLTAQIQQFLMSAGLYPGPADGITGPLTADAIRAYQRQNELQTDGAATQSLLKHMLGNEEAFAQGSRQ